jgi:hypothetical protein
MIGGDFVVHEFVALFALVHGQLRAAGRDIPSFATLLQALDDVDQIDPMKPLATQTTVIQISTPNKRLPSLTLGGIVS